MKINSLKNTKIAKVIRGNRPLKSAVKLTYKIAMFPFTRKGIDINIGGAGNYKLDYNFAFSDYESFGNRHNAGFRKWIECCKGKRTVFDVGAHIGLYTIPASRVIAPNGLVYAFEPSEANRMYLKRHLAYNGINNVVISPCLVGEKAVKKQIFYENKKTDPMNSRYPKKNISRYAKVYREQVSLDDFCENSGINPDVIKIDVEGTECNVLNGARVVMTKYRPIIFLSVHPNQMTLFQSSVDELRGIITDMRYFVHEWDGKEVSEFEHKEYILTPA